MKKEQLSNSESPKIKYALADKYEKENKELLEYGRTQNMAFNKDWWSKNQYENPNSESITQQFFKGTGKEYADLMMKIKSGKCDSDNCTDEMGQVTALEAYPQATADFIGNINIPERVANCTFGGENNSLLYITASTSLYLLETGTKGR